MGITSATPIFTPAISPTPFSASICPPGTSNFVLQYNDNEIQELTISAGSLPYVSDTGQPLIGGTFDLTYGGQTATVNLRPIQ